MVPSTASCRFDHYRVASNQPLGCEADHSTRFSERGALIHCFMPSPDITIVAPVFNVGRSRPRTSKSSGLLYEGYVVHLPDYLIAVFWFASTAFLGATGWVIAGRLFPQDSVLNRIAHAIVIGWAHIVAVGTAPGSLRSTLASRPFGWRHWLCGVGLHPHYTANCPAYKAR